ncbi:MAG: aminotransferase class IV [Candidatus Planktophila sp.]
MKAWLNDSIVDAESLHLSTDNWPDGFGVFETIKTVGGIPYALNRHMRRAIDAGARVGVEIPKEDRVRKAIDNLLATAVLPVGRLRLLFKEDGTFIATHDPYTEISHNLKLCTYPTRIDIAGIPSKTFPYISRLEILKEAQAQGCDEAIVINSEHEVCEGAVSNLIFYSDGTWITPPILQGVLPGVMRALVVENLPVKVRKIDTNDLSHVQAAIVISSLKLAAPVVSIDGRTMPDLQIGESFAEEIREMAIRTSVG